MTVVWGISVFFRLARQISQTLLVVLAFSAMARGGDCPPPDTFREIKGLASDVTALVIGGGRSKPKPFPGFRGPSRDIILDSDPLAPVAAEPDYCSLQCSSAFASNNFKSENRVDCALFNQDFKRVCGGPQPLDAVHIQVCAYQADQVELLVPRRISADKRGAAAHACASGIYQALKKTIHGPIDGIKMAVQLLWYMGTGGPLESVYRNRGVIKSELLSQLKSCATPSMGGEKMDFCALDLLYKQSELMQNFSDSISAIAELVAEKMGDAALAEVRSFRCSNPEAQIKMRCDLQARIYTEVFAAVAGGELGDLFKLFKVASTAGKAGLEAEYGAKLAQVVKSLADRAPRVARSLQFVAKAGASGLKSGLRVVRDVAEGLRLLKEQAIGRIVYGGEFAEAGFEAQGGKVGRYVIKFKNGQLMEVRPGDPLFAEIETKSKVAAEKYEKALSDYKFSKAKHDKEVKALEAEYGLATRPTVSQPVDIHAEGNAALNRLEQTHGPTVGPDVSSDGARASYGGRGRVTQSTTRGPKLELGQSFKKSEIDFAAAGEHLKIHHGGEIAGSQFNGAVFRSSKDVEKAILDNLPSEINYDKFGQAELTLEIKTPHGEPVGFNGMLSDAEALKRYPGAKIERIKRVPGGVDEEINGIQGTWYPEMAPDPSGKWTVLKNADGSIKNTHGKWDPWARTVKVPKGDFQAGAGTNKVSVIIRRDGAGKPVVMTTFPGEISPAFPSRMQSRNVAGALEVKGDTTASDTISSEFWSNHVLVSTTEEAPAKVVAGVGDGAGQPRLSEKPAALEAPKSEPPGPVSVGRDASTDLPGFSKHVTELCPECPLRYQVTKKSVAHANQHFPSNPIRDIRDAEAFARPDRTTNIYSDGTRVEDVLKSVNMSDRIAFDPKAKELISQGSATIAFDIDIVAKDGSVGRVRVVTCIQVSCADDAGRKVVENVFKKGDVVSTFPICGPNVLSIPYARYVAKAVAKFKSDSPFGTGDGKLKIIPCK